ncbi:deoxynucleoside kinase [Exiguobacterium flavidum]|uniref:deoxynucleoside kinase n=1 Tax=Exiguobacterium flavidum TaxID=2184695 RepID=UPI000DF866DA|nr:deoxynucleoside kinase [Exiguobacterium flavidum]
MFITVEGPIGVGKTSLANAISHHFSFSMLREIVEENPFLGKFYEDIEEWSFQTEMFFLCNRFKQLDDIERHYLSQRRSVVADYHIFKNLIFAHRSLKTEHIEKYEQIYSILTTDMPKPDAVIYLNASIDTLMKRVALRGREVEENMSRDYLERLAADYETFVTEFQAKHPEVKVIRFDGDQIDFVKRPEDLDFVLNKIRNELYEGANHA